MTAHLADETMARLVRTGDPEDGEHRQHLADCTGCRTRLAVWQDIGAALREEAAGSVTAAPDFDTLLGAALGSGTADGRA
ncbi:hypothetical protein ACWD6I_31950, partial [Streptomyces sp. NPDC002454]